MKRLLVLTLAASLGSTAAFAQFPEKPVTFVFPNQAGGGFYNIALSIANRLDDQIGQPIAVQPMAGAATATGTRFVAEQPADGYTLEFIHEGVMQASLLGMLGFSLMDVLEPLASVVTTYPGIYALSDAPYDNLDELVEYAKANPGEVKLAINTGSSAHIAMIAISTELGIQDDVRLVHTPGGGAGFQQGLLSGDVNVVQVNPFQFDDMVKVGTVKPLAFTGDERDPLIPDTPTMTEQGYQTPASVTSTGYFWIRKDTPDDIKQFWRDALETLLTDEATVSELEDELQVDLEFISGPEMEAAASSSFDERQRYMELVGLLEN